MRIIMRVNILIRILLVTILILYGGIWEYLSNIVNKGIVNVVISLIHAIKKNTEELERKRYNSPKQRD